MIEPIITPPPGATQMRRAFTLRTKIFAFLLSIGVAILGAFALLIQPMLLDSVDRIVERESRQHLEIVADALLPLLLQNQFAGIHESLDTLRSRQPTWRRVELVGEGGRRLYPLGRVATSTLPDSAYSIPAMRRARGRVATVSVNSFQFRQPVSVGDIVSLYTEIIHVGHTSMKVRVEVFAERNYANPVIVKVTEAELTYVAIDGDARKRDIPDEK